MAMRKIYFQITNLILICILFLTLHLITNEVITSGWEELVLFFGFEVNLNFIYDLNLFIILILIIIEVILVLSNELKKLGV